MVRRVFKIKTLLQWTNLMEVKVKWKESKESWRREKWSIGQWWSIEVTEKNINNHDSCKNLKMNWNINIHSVVVQT